MSDIKNILPAFSHEARLRITILLMDSSLSVKSLVQILHLPQSTVSRHLTILRKGCIVRVRRYKTHSYYSYNTEGTFGPLKRRLISTYYETLKDIEPFKEDMARLREIKRNAKIITWSEMINRNLTEKEMV